MKRHTTNPRIRPEVAAKLGYYVYAYVDPRDGMIFYVGKGCRSRALAHLDDTPESEKARRMAELNAAGLQPRIDILAHGMADEETAFRIEAAVIDVLCPRKSLTNRVRGFRTLEFGRVPLSELEFLYAARPVTITEPAILIRINRLYQSGMSAGALYEATRGVWRLGTRRERAKFALAVFKGVVREVYTIESWHPAGTTTYQTRTRKEVDIPRRCEFKGNVTGELGAKYRGHSVEKYFRRNSQNPVVYVNC